jgi:hypothetical protein
MPGRGRQERPIDDAELRPRDLSAQDLELVAQDRQLDVFHVQAAPAPNQRAQQSANREADKEKTMTQILPSRAAKSSDTTFGALHGGDDVFVLITEVGRADVPFGKRLAQRAPTA